MRLQLLFSASLLTAAVFPAGAAGSNALETARTTSAVIRADDKWSSAELYGDVKYLDKLLLPQYRSVDVGGRVHDKGVLLLAASRNASDEKHRRASILANATYRIRHPFGTSVLLNGDTAIVTFYSRNLGPSKGVMSCDIFIYRKGAWHAIYSQHTNAERL